MSGATAVVSVDNLYAGVSDETYTPATENDNPIYNIDKDKTEKPDDDTPKLPDTTPDVERDPGVNDFSGDEIGSRPSGIDTRLESAGASVTVSMHASAPEKGNVVRFISNDGAGDNLFVMNNGATSGSCFVFEADMCIGADSSTYISHVNVGNAYMFWIVKSGSSIIVRESTTTQNTTAVQKDLATFAFDEWFNIRVEYYHGDKETVRIKVYINDTLVSTSNNYYGKTQDGTDSGPIANQPAKTTVFAFKGGIHTIYLDNVYFGVTNDVYTDD
jgi:hypothetical protein